MATQIQIRRDTSANWLSVNPVLAAGEQGLATDLKAFKIGDGSTAWNSLPYIVNGETQTAYDATERLALGTPAGTYVEEALTPNVIFFQTGADASDPDSWRALPASKEADGSFVVDMTLANVTGTVPDLNQFGVSGGVPSIGDGITANGRKVTMNTKPAGMAYMVSTGDSGQGVSITVKTTTGNAAIRWWDGTVEEGGDGSGDGVADPITFSKAIPADGSAWSGPSPKEIYVWSCTDAASPTDPTQAGDITSLDCNNNNLTTLDVSGLTVLTFLDCDNNNLTTLDVSGSTALAQFFCENNNITFLDLSNLENGWNMNVSNNSLANVIPPNPLSAIVSSGTWLDLKNNALDVDALNTFYGNLDPSPANSGYFIIVSGNTGTSGDDPSLAPAAYTIVE